MTYTFADTRRRKASRKGYIRRVGDRMYLAMEHDSRNRVRYRAMFDTYLQAKSWMFRRGLWVER